ncbi:MAG: hypothetical protein M1825_002336 [Sarcosagium campestre]|nr:MAG: hypothetical protein M1825_002336 [Sarcosagium campestre]
MRSDARLQDFVDDEDSTILDDGILDSLDSTEVFSPTQGDWGDFSDHNALSGTSTNPFFKNPNPFPAYSSNASSWNSGSCTPTPIYENFPAENEANSGFGRPSASSNRPAAFPVQLSDSHVASVLSAASASIGAGPTSPGRDWMSSSSTEQPEPRSIPKRMRPGSPFAASPTLMRRDGIRKKNARFDIPAERNLLNIDRLIAHSADEQEIKELKQQKRLLRNRQAAYGIPPTFHAPNVLKYNANVDSRLDSRQRKKQHTERLEEEKKHYTTLISDLEERCAELEIRESEHMRQAIEWKTTAQRYEQYIDGLHLDKEEMVRSHTLETGDLRKKNAFLTEHIQKLESSAMSAAQSSSGLTSDYVDVDGANMNGSSWDNFAFPYDFSVEPEPEQEPGHALVLSERKPEQAVYSDDNKPATSGLLLVLLLCGAFVASKSSTSTTPSIPRMPEDIRAASATVLDNIFKDAGVQHSDSRLPSAGSRVQTMEPVASNLAWVDASASTTGAQDMMTGLGGPSSLDVLSERFVQPTKEQEQEQLFSLSADQYNGVTSQDFLRKPEAPSTSQGRRNLVAGLNALRNNNNNNGKDSAAEVYTRSLMWDKVPKDVVRDFAKFIADSNARNAESAHSGGGDGSEQNG